MTVKEEIQLRLSGVTSAEIKDLKEREKLEKGAKFCANCGTKVK